MAIHCAASASWSINVAKSSFPSCQYPSPTNLTSRNQHGGSHGTQARGAPDRPTTADRLVTMVPLARPAPGTRHVAPAGRRHTETAADVATTTLEPTIDHPTSEIGNTYSRLVADLRAWTWRLPPVGG